MQERLEYSRKSKDTSQQLLDDSEEVERLTVQVDQLRIEIDQLREELEQMHQQLAESRKECESGMSQRMELEEKHQSELAAVEETLQRASSSVAEQRASAAAQQGELVSVVRQLEDQRNELQAALDDREVQLEAQSAQINNLECKVDVNTRVQQGSDDILQQQVRQQEADMKRLKQKLADSMTLADECSAQAESQKAENEQLRTQLSQAAPPTAAPSAGLVRSALQGELTQVRQETTQKINLRNSQPPTKPYSVPQPSSSP